MGKPKNAGNGYEFSGTRAAMRACDFHRLRFARRAGRRYQHGKDRFT